jgi:hypothetical protein
VLVSAPTHGPVDLLMEGIARLLPQRYRADRTARIAGRPHPITLLRLHSEGAATTDGPIEHIPVSRYVSTLRAALKEGVAIVGGTTGALLRGQEKLRESKTMAHTKAAALAVDEAAMMLTPHVVALATLLTDEGRILLAGDHRQLGVILTHHWEEEDRPNIVEYQPQASAYVTVQALTEHPAVSPAMAQRIGLSLSRRLPAAIRRLVAPVYAQDGITLRGPQRPVVPPGPRPAGEAGQVVWDEDAGIYLVVHEERGSRRANHLEAAIVARVLALAPTTPAGETAIVTAHRAQRVLLRQVCTALGQYGTVGAPIDIIDTVNRVQGDERDMVIVTPATSDPNAIAETAEFILDPHRATVAFTRSKQRLIVVCARDLLDFVPMTYERYEDAILWKLLRHLCTHLVDTMVVDGVTVRVYTPPPGAEVATACDSGTAT